MSPTSASTETILTEGTKNLVSLNLMDTVLVIRCLWVANGRKPTQSDVRKKGTYCS